MAQGHGQGDELFLNYTPSPPPQPQPQQQQQQQQQQQYQQQTGAAEGTPAPLRIHKTSSPQPSGGTDDRPTQQWASYQVPPSSSAAQTYGMPTSPPPAGPLPQPYQNHYQSSSRQGTPTFGERRAPSRSETPNELAEEGRGGHSKRASINSDMSAGSSGGRRARFQANDPNRPTMGGYGYGFSPPPQAENVAEQPPSQSRSLFPESPGGPEPPEKDDEDLFQRQPNRQGTPASAAAPAPAAQEPYPDYQQQYYPPPLSAASPAPAQRKEGQGRQGNLNTTDPSGVNRLDSTASTSTTRASRGSPPPPETPVDANPQGLSGIEARYAASGIPGTNTLNEMQSAAAAARARQYAQPQARQYESPQPQRGAPVQVSQSQPPTAGAGRWSPTERPDSAPHGPPVTFQGNEPVSYSEEAAGQRGTPSQQRTQPTYPPQPQSAASPSGQMENGMAGLSVNEEPPPAYSPPVAGSAQSQYPNEKGRYNTGTASPAQTTTSAGARIAQDPNIRQHPAFHNDPQQPSQIDPHQQLPAQQNGASSGLAPVNVNQANQSASPGPADAGPASPPPLPEGWIAHLDSNSGQYYYIHLPTQSTQWEFPKGPNPLNLQEPMSPVSTFQNPLTSPTGSTFKQPLASPSFGPVPQTAGFPQRESMMSMNSLAATPTSTIFTGPPPTAGVEMYKVAPTNGVYFGPYLRYTNMDLERGLWLGSIMLVSDAAHPPTIHIHQSTDLSPNPRQLKAHPIYSHQRWIFYRYDVDLRMEEDHPAKWTYAITSHLGCTRYEFLVASRHETSWRFIAHSGNDFALNVSANERTRLGGIPLMWKDVLLKHQECGGFHVQIGLGGQIYADRLWKDIQALRQWTQMSGKDNRKNAQWTAKMDEDATHAYFHYYTSHFDQPAIREAFAQIPHICALDDHDIFDGYGSYPDYMQQSHVFKNLGRIGIDMYLLFQHHTTHEILRNVSNDIDLFTITGTGWHYVKYLGPSVVVVGPDTRGERNTHQVMAGPTYQGLFPKIAVLPPSVQHCMWIFPVPVIYPRLEAVEHVASTVATGKKAVTGGFNMLGKVAGGVAGIVGAKGVVNSGFDGVKKAVGKSGLMQGVLSPFGEVEVLDELRDMWTHESKDLERTYIIRTLQGISHNKSLRMTFLSGSVNVCGAGLVHDPSHPSDHKTMYQLITSSIVNGPMPSYVLRMLHNSKPLYIPANGHRSTPSQPTDTKEDMMEIFAADVDGRQREMRRLMARRNYLACVIYDPDVVQGSFGTVTPGAKGAGRLSLAADFMVQNEGSFGQPLKYGPVVIPSLEYGR